MQVKTKEEIKGILADLFNFFGQVLCSGQKIELTAKQECFLYQYYIEINNYAKSVNENSPVYSVYTDFFKEKLKSEVKTIEDFSFDFGFSDKR